MRTALDRLRAQIDVLFRSDARGHLLDLNEEPSTTAPRVFLGRTLEGNLWRVHACVSDETRRALDSLCAAEPLTDALEHPPLCADALRKTLERDAPVSAVYRGPAFHFPDGFAYETSAERIDPSRRESVALLREHFPSVAETIHQSEPCLVVVRDGAAVSAAFTARATSLAAECGAQTALAYRGCGHAVSAVAAWAEVTRREGVAPLYSTEWSNAASRRVSEKLGLILYGEDFHLR